MAQVEKRSEMRTPVAIFTPSQLTVLLKNASRELAPCFALAAFAGLRSEEILRLEWADVMRRPGFIEVAAHKAKTAARRLVPITNNLERWLNPSLSNKGLIWPHDKGAYFKIRLRVAKKAKVSY